LGVAFFLHWVAYFFDPLQLVGCLLVGVAFGGVVGLWFGSCNPFGLVALVGVSLPLV